MYLLKFSKVSLFKIQNLLPAIFCRNFFLRSIYLQLVIIDVAFLHCTYREERSVWLELYLYFVSLFLSSFFFFFLVFSLADTNDSQDSRDGRGNHRFSCFPLPTTHKHLALLFTQSICNYQTYS